MNKNRKMLSRLLVPLLALSGVNMDAMEKVNSMRSWKLPLSQNIPRDGENKFENPDALKKWHNSEALMTIDELEDWLNRYRSEIFYAMHQGDTKRSIANFKIGIKQNSILNAFKKWHNYAKQKSKSNIKWTENVNWRIQPAKKMKELIKKIGKDYKYNYERKNLENYLSFPAKDGYKKNWAKLGRGILNEPGHAGDKNVIKSELQRAERGDVNCTIWASLINWFLNENGYPAKMYQMLEHEFVLVPVTDESKQKIYLCKINVIENTPSLDTAKIKVDFLCESRLSDDIWQGLGLVQRGVESSYDSKYNPTFIQFNEIKDGGLTKLNVKQITAITKGLTDDLNYWYEERKIITDKEENVRKFPLKLLPRYENTFYIPLNLEYLDYAIEGKDGKKIYVKKEGAPGTKKETNLIYAIVHISGKDISEEFLNKDLRLNVNVEGEYCSAQIIGKDENPYKSRKFFDAKLYGLDTKMNEAVAFWNDPNYQDPVIKKKK